MMMQPEQGMAHLKFGGGVAESVFSPFVLGFVLLAGILVLVWPRNKAVAAFLAAALLIPVDHVLVIGGTHFPMLRVLLLFGIARLLKDRFSSKGRVWSGGVTKMDVAFILLTVLTALNGILLFRESGAVVYQIGQLFSTFGAYLLLRSLIRNEQDVVHTIEALAWIAAVVALIMSYEIFTGHDPYALLGGSEAAKYASLEIRDDRVRAQGPFAHSILAGSFGAILLPLFVALWWKGKKYRKVTAVGIGAATVITLACNSSTPILAYLGGVLALCLWPLRRQMRLLRRGIVATLIVLQIVLKHPVWHLITRIDLSGGSSSWHRFMLIDQCIHHFGDWWLFGVKDTSVWGWDMWDTANEYVGLCDGSGLLPFLCFLAVLVYGFKYLGRARRSASNANDKKRALFLWALGAALFANVVAFFGISYFDQTTVAWYTLLAIIPAAISARPKAQSPEGKYVSVPGRIPAHVSIRGPGQPIAELCDI
jgi:hypothetical protein